MRNTDVSYGLLRTSRLVKADQCFRQRNRLKHSDAAARPLTLESELTQSGAEATKRAATTTADSPVRAPWHGEMCPVVQQLLGAHGSPPKAAGRMGLSSWETPRIVGFP